MLITLLLHFYYYYDSNTYIHFLNIISSVRSLSSRNLELWFNDGRDGIQQGHLHMGQETTTCSYPGHRFFVTEAGHKDTHVVDFLITSDRVCMYAFTLSN